MLIMHICQENVICTSVYCMGNSSLEEFVTPHFPVLHTSSDQRNQKAVNSVHKRPTCPESGTEMSCYQWALTTDAFHFVETTPEVRKVFEQTGHTFTCKCSSVTHSPHQLNATALFAFQCCCLAGVCMQWEKSVHCLKTRMQQDGDAYSIIQSGACFWIMRRIVEKPVQWLQLLLQRQQLHKPKTTRLGMCFSHASI